MVSIHLVKQASTECHLKVLGEEKHILELDTLGELVANLERSHLCNCCM